MLSFRYRGEIVLYSHCFLVITSMYIASTSRERIHTRIRANPPRKTENITSKR